MTMVPDDPASHDGTADPLDPGVVISRITLNAADGISLSALLAAPSDSSVRSGRPPVLAVHGFGANAYSGWERNGHLRALATTGRHVIAVDLRGHGHSAKPQHLDAYRLPLILEDLIRAASYLGTDTTPIDLLGYSLGARLCWTIAERAMLPVRRVVIGGFDGRPAFAGVTAERARTLGDMFTGNDPVALHCFVTALAGTGEDSTAPPPAVPTLVVAGDRDPVARSARTFALGLVNGRFRSIADRSHTSTVTAPGFRRAVVEFLGADAAG